MKNYLEFTIDKFVFHIADDRYYTENGMWVILDRNQIRVGMSDYLQQRSGDIAFAEVKPEGTILADGDELAVIETIKVNISLTTPVAGKVVQVNSALQTSPEAINQDPYEAGWIAVIEPKEGENSKKNLLDPHTYYSRIKMEAEQEVNSK
jgi:glycine cleavage system H protein